MLDLNVVNKTRIYCNAFHITIANFIFGYTVGVFNTCQDNVAYSMGWSESEKSLYTALFSTFIPVGAFFGSSVTALMCNNIGRLRTMLVMDAITILGSILSGNANSSNCNFYIIVNSKCHQNPMLLQYHQK